MYMASALYALPPSGSVILLSRACTIFMTVWLLWVPSVQMKTAMSMSSLMMSLSTYARLKYLRILASVPYRFPIFEHM